FNSEVPLYSIGRPVVRVPRETHSSTPRSPDSITRTNSVDSWENWERYSSQNRVTSDVPSLPVATCGRSSSGFGANSSRSWELSPVSSKLRSAVAKLSARACAFVIARRYPRPAETNRPVAWGPWFTGSTHRHAGWRFAQPSDLVATGREE